MKDRRHIFSHCRRYRYTLWREWETNAILFAFDPSSAADVGSEKIVDITASAGTFVQFVGLNPSTADETRDDPTVRRCIEFAKSWGFGAMCMTNAFGWRDTDPEKMKAEARPASHGCMSGPMSDPRGFTVNVHDADANDWWVEAVARHAALVVCCWGKDGRHLDREDQVLKVLSFREVHCLGTNGDGTPKHPLYLPSITKPELFRSRGGKGAQEDTLRQAERDRAHHAKPLRPEPAPQRLPPALDLFGNPL
jgi:hypothetical protein